MNDLQLVKQGENYSIFVDCDGDYFAEGWCIYKSVGCAPVKLVERVRFAETIEEAERRILKKLAIAGAMYEARESARMQAGQRFLFVTQ
jgi:hypothetical protein